jgi:hypothetical protein
MAFSIIQLSYFASHILSFLKSKIKDLFYKLHYAHHLRSIFILNYLIVKQLNYFKLVTQQWRQILPFSNSIENKPHPHVLWDLIKQVNSRLTQEKIILCVKH